MTSPTAVPTSINFAGALLFDDKANFIAVTSGSTFNVSQSYLPIAVMGDNGKALPLGVASGSLALKVTQVGARPVVGEYRAATTLINGAASAQNLLSIENPTGSGKIVIVKRLGVTAVVVAVAATNFLYRLGRHNGFPTNGTTITATKRLTSDPDPVAIVRQSPGGSITNNMWVGSPGSVITAVGHMQPFPLCAIDTNNDIGDVILHPGEALIMLADANDTDWRHFSHVLWQEST